MIKFQCEQCGICCTKVGEHDLYQYLDRGDGTCRYFDDQTRKCTIYETRPNICNVEWMYQHHYKEQYSKAEFFELNKSVCQRWQHESFLSTQI